MIESIGKRIAFLRQKNGWTQQSLAKRLAMSRVAISHIEMDLTIPSERTITLMAGVFKLSPIDMVEATSYPLGKTERLPELTTIFTHLEMSLALINNDIQWLDRLSDPVLLKSNSQRILDKWLGLIEASKSMIIDEHELIVLSEMKRLLRIISDRTNHYLD